MKNILFAGAAMALAAIASPALAREESHVDFYVGAQAGYHNIGENAVGGDGGAIFGGYAGVDFGSRVIVGVEGNINIGTGIIDAEYGVAAKLGVRTSDTGQIFARFGYQQVHFNVPNLTGLPIPNFSIPAGDYMAGVGGQFMVSDNMSVRAVVDTIAFETVRGTVGLAFHF